MCGIEIYELGFQIVTTVFFIGARKGGVWISVDSHTFFDHFDAATMALRTEFRFRDSGSGRCLGIQCRYELFDKRRGVVHIIEHPSMFLCPSNAHVENTTLFTESVVIGLT